MVARRLRLASVLAVASCLRAPVARTPRWRAVGAHGEAIPHDGAYPGLRYLSRSPDVLLIESFLGPEECDALVAAGREASLERSPVAYAGWSEDVAELVQTWASGPAAWLALGAILVEANAFGETDRVALAATAAGVYVINLVLAGLGALAFAKRREASLAALRTSKSVALRGDAPSAAEVATFSRLLDVLPGVAPERCEALTLIRYEAGDKLAPHFDANRAATDEDARRGGQTLSTLLVYLNDVENGAGGRTIFNRLGVHVEPKRGDACVFFPAAADGTFDDRLEHEGEEARAEKWIARVWVHENPIAGATGAPRPTVDAVLAARRAAAASR